MKRSDIFVERSDYTVGRSDHGTISDRNSFGYLSRALFSNSGAVFLATFSCALVSKISLKIICLCLILV